MQVMVERTEELGLGKKGRGGEGGGGGEGIIINIISQEEEEEAVAGEVVKS